MTFHPFSANFSELLDGHFFVAGAVFGEFGQWTPAALRIVNSVSVGTRINHEIHYLVRSDNDICYLRAL